MNRIIEVEIKGVKRALVFNNYARLEIARVLNLDPLHILDAIEEMSSRNNLLLLKTLVYAGHCGDCYRRQDTTDLSREEIGEWIGEADEDSLYAVFTAFMESEGLGLPATKEESKKKATKRSTRQSTGQKS